VRRSIALVLGATALVVLCGAGGAYATWGRQPDVTPSRAATDRACEAAYVTAPTSAPETTLPALSLHQVARLDAPTAIAFHPGGVAVIGERTGRVFLDRDGSIGVAPVIDLSEDTAETGDAGLLNLAYDPSGEWLYVYRATAELDEVLTAYPSPGGVPDPDGEVTILTIDHPPSPMHHGGGLAFGPDGALYIGTGDGGGLGDPKGHGQSLSTWLGKILRIVPTPAADSPYTVPDDNPFVHRGGAQPEIFSYGLRNPFRLSFDRATGDLWIADVGQSCWEEIDYRAAGHQGGENFGWDRREGTHRFEGTEPGDHVLPLHDYSHKGGHCVVIGGFVYRGAAIPRLDGAYLFTDYCKGQVIALRQSGGERESLERTTVTLERPVSVAEDLDGEPWLLSLEGGVYQLEAAP
jgi:glucose/arabinose dehydrogenase